MVAIWNRTGGKWVHGLNNKTYCAELLFIFTHQGKLIYQYIFIVAQINSFTFSVMCSLFYLK